MVAHTVILALRRPGQKDWEQESKTLLKTKESKTGTNDEMPSSLPPPARCLPKFSPIFLLFPFHIYIKAETLQSLRIICLSFPAEHWIGYTLWKQYFGLCATGTLTAGPTGLYSGYRQLDLKVTVSLFLCALLSKYRTFSKKRYMCSVCATQKDF